jgi:hypothetical protein
MSGPLRAKTAFCAIDTGASSYFFNSNFATGERGDIQRMNLDRTIDATRNAKPA